MRSKHFENFVVDLYVLPRPTDPNYPSVLESTGLTTTLLAMELYYFVTMGVSINNQLVPNQTAPMSDQERQRRSEAQGTPVYVYQQSSGILIYKALSVKSLSVTMAAAAHIRAKTFVDKANSLRSQ